MRLGGTLGTLACALFVAAAWFGSGYAFERLEGKGGGQGTQPSSLDGADVDVRLATAPNEGAGDYYGIGMPYILVTVTRELGGLHRLALYAEAEAVSFEGVDGCQGIVKWDSFYAISPVGGVPQDSKNATYAGESYTPPQDALPGADHCAIRAGTASEWSVTVCLEGDGRIVPEPGSVERDPWDICLTTRHMGQMGSGSLKTGRVGLGAWPAPTSSRSSSGPSPSS